MCLFFAYGSLPGWAQVMNAAGAANAPLTMNVTAADPFDIETGIYYRSYTDLYMPGSIPILLVRTQRNMDLRSRSFGIGASTSYDMFIVGDTAKFSWVALVMANGSKEMYARVSPGTGYADGVFENKASPGEFYGSRIFWNGNGGWTVQMCNGRQYTIQGCGAASNPGQCAMTEERNDKGARLTIQRDKAGNILRITTPEGRYIAFDVDSAGRIKRIQDDSGNRWVNYHYYANGALKDTWSRRGEKQEFGYDDHFNMTSIHETGPANVPLNPDPAIPESARPFLDPAAFAKRYDFTVLNGFDSSNRLKSQDTSFGQHWSVQYGAPAGDNSKINTVDGPDGRVRYFFNPSGYAFREEYSGKLSGWDLEIVRQAGNNAITGMTLVCMPGNMRVDVPTSVNTRNGEGRRETLSGMCDRAAKGKAPPVSGRLK